MRDEDRRGTAEPSSLTQRNRGERPHVPFTVIAGAIINGIGCRRRSADRTVSQNETCITFGRRSLDGEVGGKARRKRS